MRLWTLSEIRTKIERDLDLEGEDFVQLDELNGYINEAIDECEAIIHKLGMEDEYFLSRAFLPLVVGQEEYELPADIYANKIRRIVYHNQTTIFPIRRVRHTERYEYVDQIAQNPPGRPYYTYMIINPTAGDKPKILLIPVSDEASSQNVKIWYIRNANRLEVDADVCDIPEFVHYVIKYAKWRVYHKEGNPQGEIMAQELDRERQLMIETLENMVPDEDSEIQKDLSFYRESS